MYLVYDEEFRFDPHQRTSSKLMTDETEEYVTYLYNLPEKRYDKAKKLK